MRSPDHARGRTTRRVLLTVTLTLAAVCVSAESTRVPLLGAAELRTLLDQRSGQVVLVNFWATWCRPCLDEIPALQSLAERYRERGLVLVAVSLDEPEALDVVVQPFIDRWFPGFRSYLRREPSMDAMVSAIDPAWNEILPTSYLIDRDGRVARRLQGGQSEAEFAEALRPLLAP